MNFIFELKLANIFTIVFFKPFLPHLSNNHAFMTIAALMNAHIQKLPFLKYERKYKKKNAPT